MSMLPPPRAPMFVTADEQPGYCQAKIGKAGKTHDLSMAGVICLAAARYSPNLPRS